MDPHPIPRQITTFEFKLIGFLTLRQFIYLTISSSLAVVLFYLTPIPLFNLLLASLPALLGIALAFVPYNDRPLDVWIKNFIKKLFSPSQYYYMKKNQPPDFLKDVFVYSTSQSIQTHIDANQKLSSYLSQKNTPPTENLRKQQINELIHSHVATTPNVDKTADLLPTKTSTTPHLIKTAPPSQKNPFIFGVVKNNKNVPLPNVLIYIKNKNGQNMRLLKTNAHGVFASFNALPPDDYLFEIKDLGGKYFFDTIKVNATKESGRSLNFVSKETL
jgi:hypothetical protein